MKNTIKFFIFLFVTLLSITTIAQPDYSRIFKESVNKQFINSLELKNQFNFKIAQLGKTNPYLIPLYIKNLNNSITSRNNPGSLRLASLSKRADSNYNLPIEKELMLLDQDTSFSFIEKRISANRLENLMVEGLESSSDNPVMPEPDQSDHFLVYLFLCEETGLLQNPDIDYKQRIDSISQQIITNAVSSLKHQMNEKQISLEEINSLWYRSWYWMDQSGTDLADFSIYLFKLFAKPANQNAIFRDTPLNIFAQNLDHGTLRISNTISAGTGLYNSFHYPGIFYAENETDHYPGFKSKITIPHWVLYGEYAFRWTNKNYPLSAIGIGVWFTTGESPFPGSSTRTTVRRYLMDNDKLDEYTYNMQVKSSSASYFSLVYTLLAPVYSWNSFSFEAGYVWGIQETKFSGDLPYTMKLNRYKASTGEYEITLVNKKYDFPISGSSRYSFDSPAIRVKYILPWYSEVAMNLTKNQILLVFGGRLQFDYGFF